MNIDTFMLPSKEGSPALELLKSGTVENEQRPPILFVHGYTSGAWQFAKYWMPELHSDGWQSYALNLRGHGKSEGRETVQKVRFVDYAEDLARTVRHVREETGHDPILIGHSLGSVLARDYAANYPLSGLGLLSFGDIAIGMKGFMRWMMKRYPFQGMMGMMTGRPSALFTKFEPQYAVMYEGQDKDAVRDNVNKLMEQPDSDKVFMELSKLSFGQPLKKISVFVMAGTNDPIASPASVKQIGDIYDTEPVLLQDAAHDIVAGPDWIRGFDPLRSWLTKIA